MLDLNQILRFFPEHVQDDTKSLIREYLQCKILNLIFQSKIANKLIFIGGTALRIVYDIQRFSEDLDFDNKDLTLDDWIELGGIIRQGLAKEGIEVDIAKTRLNDTVFHHNLRFTGIFFQYKISPHKNEVLLIKTDSENQGINYKHDIVEINRFDVITKMKVMPLDIALSQKFRAFFDREMGRDLFDISSIAPQTRPNYAYLEAALGISDPKVLKEKVLARCQELDIEALAERAKPFLFNKDTDMRRILHFYDYMKQYKF